MIADLIRSVAEDEEVPVFGIGPASAMADEKPGHRPEDLLPGAQSLICFGIPVPYGVYNMPNYREEMVWRSQNLHYRRLDTLSLRFAALLEESGERAAPIYGCLPMGVNEKGVVVGYLNQIRMGEATGIGVIGKNGLLIHSRYGARLMLGGVVTTARLPEMRYPETNEPGCPPECQICIQACPVDAISAEKRRLRIMKCLSYTSRTPLMSRTWFGILSLTRPESAARLMNLRTFDEHTFHICSLCVSRCPYGSNHGEHTRI